MEADDAQVRRPIVNSRKAIFAACRRAVLDRHLPLELRMDAIEYLGVSHRHSALKKLVRAEKLMADPAFGALRRKLEPAGLDAKMRLGYRETGGRARPAGHGPH